jgi:hypothetical protein
MSPQDIREMLRATPFVPFRLHTTEGRSYVIRHPDEAIVLFTRVVLAAPTDSENGFAERLEHIALAHIVRVEELPAGTSPSTN